MSTRRLVAAPTLRCLGSDAPAAVVAKEAAPVIEMDTYADKIAAENARSAASGWGNDPRELNLFTHHKKAMEEFGFKGWLMKMMQFKGIIKHGELKGIDKIGNKYYEDLSGYSPYGQHRWVEYVDDWNYDASMVPPEWHGWLHHMTDECGSESHAYLNSKMATSHPLGDKEDAPYAHALGLDTREGVPAHSSGEYQHNWTHARSRGYGVGSLLHEYGEEEKWHKRVEHPLHPKHKEARFSDVRGFDYVDPNAEEGTPLKDSSYPSRDLDKI